MQIHFVREVSKQILAPLAFIYCVGLLLVYNSLGGLLGLSFGIYALVIKLIGVVAFSGYSVYLACAQIDKIASQTRTSRLGRRLTKFFVAGIAFSLLVITPLMADQVGLTYT